MNPFPTPPPETIILLGWSLPCIALISLGAFAVLSSRHNCKLLELKLNECQTTSRLSEKEFAIAIKAMDVQVLALKSKNEELHQRLLGLEKRNEELVCIVAQSDAEFLRRSAEVEKTWSKERDDIQRESDLEILSFKVNLRAVEAVCASRGYQIQNLTHAKEELLTVRVQHELKILELTDKLSEYHRRLTSGRAGLNSSDLLQFPSCSEQPQESDLRHIRTAPTIGAERGY